MSGVVAAVESKVPQDCQTSTCKKSGCSASMADLPENRVLIDLDCTALDLPQDRKRCDYVLVGGDSDPVWVAVIELKSSEVRASTVAGQLQGGAAVAHQWLPVGRPFRFVPILVHGRGIHPRELKSLRRVKIKLGAQARQAVLTRCGGALVNALAKA